MLMGISFFRFGKFSSIILLKIFTGPLSWESSLSFIPIILRFGLLIVSWRCTEGQEIEQRCVAMGDGELGVATRKSQTPGKQETPRTQRG